MVNIAPGELFKVVEDDVPAMFALEDVATGSRSLPSTDFATVPFVTLVEMVGIDGLKTGDYIERIVVSPDSPFYDDSPQAIESHKGGVRSFYRPASNSMLCFAHIDPDTLKPLRPVFVYGDETFRVGAITYAANLAEGLIRATYMSYGDEGDFNVLLLVPDLNDDQVRAFTSDLMNRFNIIVTNEPQEFSQEVNYLTGYNAALWRMFDDLIKLSRPFVPDLEFRANNALDYLRVQDRLLTLARVLGVAQELDPNDDPLDMLEDLIELAKSFSDAAATMRDRVEELVQGQGGE